jgi:hypothetical protein
MNKLTSYELGNFLIELGEKLKNYTDEELEYVITIRKKKKSRNLSDYEFSENIEQLALQIKTMSRDETEKKLLTLKSKQLIELCRILLISTSGKKKKDEIIKRILYSLFDTIEGHRLIRNFSQSSD